MSRGLSVVLLCLSVVLSWGLDAARPDTAASLVIRESHKPVDDTDALLGDVESDELDVSSVSSWFREGDTDEWTLEGSLRRRFLESSFFLCEESDGSAKSICADEEADNVSVSNATDSLIHNKCGYDSVQDDDAEGQIIAILGLLAGVLTLVGTGFVLFTYAFLPNLRNPRTLSQIQLAICNAIFAIRAMMNENIHVYDPETCCPTPMCYLTATILTFSSTGAIFWSVSITLQAYFLLVLRFRERTMQQFDKFFYIFSYGLAFVLAIWGLLAGYYAPAGLHCWIPATSVWQQVVFFYFWTYLCDVGLIAMLIHIGSAVRGTKATAVTTRYLLYAIWAVVTTFGFMVMRTRQWIYPCISTPFALQAFNAFVFPLQGFGNALIFSLNRAILVGYKQRCCSARGRQYTKEELSDDDDTGAADESGKGESQAQVQMASIRHIDDNDIRELEYSDDDSN